MPDTFIGPIFGPDARPEYIEHAERVIAKRAAVIRKIEGVMSRMARLHSFCPRHACRRHRLCQHMAAPDNRYHGPRPPCRLNEEANAAYERARRAVVEHLEKREAAGRERGGSSE